MKATSYIQPLVDVVVIHSAYSICVESKFGEFNYGGGTTTIPPETGGL